MNAELSPVSVSSARGGVLMVEKFETGELVVEWIRGLSVLALAQGSYSGRTCRPCSKNSLVFGS